MKHRTAEGPQAAFIAGLAQAAAVVLFLGMVTVWSVIGATRSADQNYAAAFQQVQ